MQDYDVIIVGGGVSGLACARMLCDEGQENFVVLTRDLRGSIPESKDTSVNYGAYYVQDTYHNFLPYADLRRPIYPTRLSFFTSGKIISLLTVRNLLNIVPLLQFLLFLRKVLKHHEAWKKSSETVSQKKALEADEFLYNLHCTPAGTFIKEHKLEFWKDNLLNHVS